MKTAELPSEASPTVELELTEALNAHLDRLEQKLDYILARLQWPTESCAAWYASQYDKTEHAPLLPLDFKPR